jgi:hypothetical protein
MSLRKLIKSSRREVKIHQNKVCCIRVEEMSMRSDANYLSHIPTRVNYLRNFRKLCYFKINTKYFLHSIRPTSVPTNTFPLLAYNQAGEAL